MKDQARSAESTPGLWLWLLSLTAFTFLLYCNSLFNGFVFDDFPLIHDNPQIHSMRNAAEIFGRHGYRPIRTLTYAINFWLFGLNPFYFHLTNVLLHAVNGVLVFFLLRRFFKKIAVAGAGALIFLCHPAQTAAVAYISGRKDLLAGGFVVAALLCFLSYLEKENRAVLVASGLLLALALFSKEVAVIFPLLLFGLDLLHGRLSPDPREPPSLRSRLREILRKRGWLYGGTLVAAAIFLYYAQFIMYASRKVSFWGGSALNNYLTSVKLFSHYLRLAAIPYPLIADYDGVFPIAQGIGDVASWVGMIVAGVYLGVVVRTVRSRPRLAFGLGWFLVTLLPVIQLFPFHEIAADHYLYLPLVGFIVAALDLAEWSLSRMNTRAVVAVTGCVVLLFSGMVVARNRDWHDTLTLWAATVAQAPDSARVRNNFGTTLHASGDLDGALPHLLRATELDPLVAAYWSNLGALYHDRGDYDAAVGALTRSVVLDPRNAYTQTNLGNAYKKLAQARAGRDAGDHLWKEALGHLQQAVALQGENGALHYNLGSAYFELGWKLEARSQFEAACRLSPDFSRGYYALALLDSQEGSIESAIAEAERSLALDPANQDAIELLLSLRQRRGEYGDARTLLESAVSRFPASSNLRLQLGLVYKTLGETAKAREQLGMALQLDPGGASADEIRRLLDSL